MKLSFVYLVLAVLGLVLPYSQLIPYLLETDSDMVALFVQPFSNRGMAVFGYDLTVSAVVFLVWLLSEIRRGSVRYGWIPILALFLVGLSMALPLFLYIREIQAGNAAGSAA